MARRTLLVVAICAAAVAVLAFAIARNWRQSGSAGDIRVGVILPETGILAPMGQVERQAMEMAADDVRATGFPLRLVFEDGKGDNKAVAAAANKLIDIDGVPILITSTTGASFAAQPIAERGKAIHIAFCMSTDLAPKSPNTIRYYVGIEEEANAIIQHLQTLPRDTPVGVMHGSVAAWTEALRNVYQPFFEKHFTRPVLVEEYDVKAKDFRAQLTTLKNAKIKVLVLLGYGFEYGPIFSQLSELGLREQVEVVGGWGFLYTSLPKESLEGIWVAGPTYVFDRGQTGSDFQSRFKARFGAQPNFDAAFAYEMVRRIPALWTLRQSKSVQGVKQGLVEWGLVDGAMGRYRFNPDGNMIAETAVGRIRDGVAVGK